MPEIDYYMIYLGLDIWGFGSIPLLVEAWGILRYFSPKNSFLVTYEMLGSACCVGDRFPGWTTVGASILRNVTVSCIS